MNPLSSQKKHFGRSAQAFLAMIFLAIPFLVPVQAVEARATQPARPIPFSEYGFEVTGFTKDQEQIIRQTLELYAQALGGPETLREIITTYSRGQNRMITYNPNRVGACTDIELSPTVFSLKKSMAANYSVYAAPNEAAHAQVVIGHEIAHLLVWAIEERSGVNWSNAYAERVGRNWKKMSHPTAPMEEAVTNLSLKVAQMGYFFNNNKDKPEADPKIAAAIDAWTVDFLTALKRLD